uniref:hypothetical protein n=1 Tax=uncultured Sphingomonas sp. TaxID=158754 RepID=UPI0035CB28C0
MIDSDPAAFVRGSLNRRDHAMEFHSIGEIGRAPLTVANVRRHVRAHCSDVARADTLSDRPVLSKAVVRGALLNGFLLSTPAEG